MLGLRKINKDGKHFDFVWPLEVGAKAIAPDWNPEAVCGGGLHLFPEGTGDLSLLDGHYWAVVEYDETKAVDLGGKVKVPECTIVHISESPDGLLEYFPNMKNPTSEHAYNWARFIGDVEYMRQFITDPKYAYYWALYIGDREYMLQFVNDPKYACMWARDIGDLDHMRQFINYENAAYFWTININIDDRDYMRQFITGSHYAYGWARDIGDVEYMRQFITDPHDAYYWAYWIGDEEYMLEIARGSEYEYKIKELINARSS